MVAHDGAAVRRRRDHFRIHAAPVIREAGAWSNGNAASARANVARSTFYAHFRDKDELLVNGIDEVLRSAEGAALRCGERHERILAFSLPLYEHIAAHRRLNPDGHFAATQVDNLAGPNGC